MQFDEICIQSCRFRHHVAPLYSASCIFHSQPQEVRLFILVYFITSPTPLFATPLVVSSLSLTLATFLEFLQPFFIGLYHISPLFYTRNKHHVLYLSHSYNSILSRIATHQSKNNPHTNQPIWIATSYPLDKYRDACLIEDHWKLQISVVWKVTQLQPVLQRAVGKL